MIPFLFGLVIAALETTVVSLPLTALAAGAPPWPLLFAAVALGWLADQVALRLPAHLERPALLAGAALAATTLIGGALGVGPAGVLVALLPGGPALLAAYVLLLLALFLFWRGTRIDTRDSAAVGALFGRGAVIAVVGMLLGAVAGTGAPLGAPVVTAQAVALVGLGLLALALAHAQESAGGRLGSFGWRYLLTLLAAVGVVVAIALLATATLGGEAANAAQTLLRLLLLPFALVGALLAWLIITYLGEPLSRLVAYIIARLQGIQPPAAPDEAYTNQQSASATLETVVQIANGATFLMALVPIAILVAAILLVRRRRRGEAADDEERESLGVLASLGGDLRELLAGLRNPFARPLGGLRAALAALGGDDPATRARRAYVRLLLLLEGRDQGRPPEQTPAEFAPAAVASTRAAESVAHLTAAYEQARYNPAGVSPAEAAAAEDALRRIEE